MQDRSKKPQKRRAAGTTRAGVALATLIAITVLAVSGTSGGQLLDMGRALSMLSVGIMQPQGGAQVLSERLDRIPAAQVGGRNMETVTPSDLSYIPGGGVQTSGELNSNPVKTTGDVPSQAGNGGKVIELLMTTGGKFVQGVAIKNGSSRTIDVAAQLKVAPKIKIKDSADPQVLIVHTHTTEQYMTYYAGYYNKNDSSRTKDESRSVVAVGEAVSGQLRAAGIGVIHNVTLHDSPEYSGAYLRSEQTVKKILKQYPTIKVVIDLHRDAINKSKTEKYKPTVTINGRKAAQIMIVTSVGNTSIMPHPNWQENLRLSLRLQSSLHKQFSGIARPLYIVDSRYNQHLTDGSMLIEVGSDANTVSEAVYSGEILGKTLTQILNTLKK